MQETNYRRSWREILKDSCENPQKKQEIAHLVGFVTVRTIDRWISGQSKPQKNEWVRKLNEAINSEEMSEALKSEFPEAFQISGHLATNVERVQLPLEFYRRVIHAHSQVPLASRRWTIFHLISNQMLPHLDAERMGLVMVYTHMVSVSSELQFEEAAGTASWTTRQLDQNSVERESWLVQAVAACHPFFIQSCATSKLFPPSCLLHWDLIQSMGFFPLYRSGMAAGGVLLCSVQEDFFTPLRQILVEEYSYLLALAFNDGDFQPAL